MLKLTQNQVEFLKFIDNEQNNEIFVYGHPRSGKTYSLISSIFIHNAKRTLIVIDGIFQAKALVKYYIEPIREHLGINCCLNIFGFTDPNEYFTIDFLLGKDLPENLYPRYDRIIIFYKHRLSYEVYKSFARRCDKIILENNTFETENKKEVKNNFEEWVYTYFVRGIIPYSDNVEKSNGISFKLSNDLE